MSQKKQPSLLRNVVRPLARRIGSLLAGALATVAYLSPEQLAQLEVALTAIAMVAVDLIFSAKARGSL